jgi:hypothetical protein
MQQTSMVNRNKKMQPAHHVDRTEHLTDIQYFSSNLYDISKRLLFWHNTITLFDLCNQLQQMYKRLLLLLYYKLRTEVEPSISLKPYLLAK